MKGRGEEIKEVQTLNIPELLTEGNVANCCYLLLSESILFKMQGKTVSVRGAQVSRSLRVATMRAEISADIFGYL